MTASLGRWAFEEVELVNALVLRPLEQPEEEGLKVEVMLAQ